MAPDRDRGSNMSTTTDGMNEGTGGEGTYSGHFAAEDKYQLNWDGHRTPQKGAMASPDKN